MSLQLQTPVQSISAINCTNCRSRTFCLPENLNELELKDANQLVQLRKRIKKGNHLFQTGMKFHAVYTIRTGFFKTTTHTANGKIQLLRFHMNGESMGLDGIAYQQYQSNSVALEDSEVCVIPFNEIEKLSRNSVAFQRHFHHRLSVEIVRENRELAMREKLSALERVARFILNLSDRYSSRGFSKFELILRMSRIEIGHHLGLTQETVCRAFSKLITSGIISLKNRELKIVNTLALEKLINTN